MSQVLPTVNTAGLAVGATGTIDLTKVNRNDAPGAAMSFQGTTGGVLPHLVFHNESGCGFQLTLNQSGHSLILGSGEWKILEVNPFDSSVQWQVLYVLPNAPVNLLLVTWYDRIETIDNPGTLGNSPLGVTGNILQVAPINYSGSESPANNTTFNAFAGRTPIGNFPFSNQAISNGTGTSGVIAALLYSCTFSVKGQLLDKTTVEGFACHFRINVLDSSLATAVTSYQNGGNGTIFEAYMLAISGESASAISFASAVPSQSVINLQVGSGAPYTIQPEILIDGNVGYTAPNFGTVYCTATIGVTAMITPNRPA